MNDLINSEADVSVIGAIGTADPEIMPAQPGRLASRNVPNKAPTYTELVKTFSALAADISKRPELSRIWMGLILYTEKLVNETPPQEARGKMLAMTTSMTKVLPNIADGSVPAMSAAHLVGDGVAMANALLLPTNNTDLTRVPLKRGRVGVVGCPDILRKKSRHEKFKNKKAAGCSMCKQLGHRVSGECGQRKALGTLVQIEEIDKLFDDLTQRHLPSFENVMIPAGALTFEQMNSDANYVCIHSFATKELFTQLSQEPTIREDTKYLCISIIFEEGKTTPSTDKCYVRSSKVTAWITKTEKNKRRVILCKNIN